MKRKSYTFWTWVLIVSNFVMKLWQPLLRQRWHTLHDSKARWSCPFDGQVFVTNEITTQFAFYYNILFKRTLETILRLRKGKFWISFIQFRFQIVRYNKFPGDQCQEADVCQTEYSWLAVVGLVVYMMGLAPGMGPLPWTINSEIFPNWSRDTAMSITTTTNWVCNSIVSQVYLYRVSQN